MNHLRLHFLGNELPELSETGFQHTLVKQTLRCVRGKSAGAYTGCNTFQWTKAVQAFSLLALRAKAQCLGRPGSDLALAPHLIGGPASFAASLDYAIDKQTTWLLDMVGFDSMGYSNARKIIQRTNPGRKRVGPVALSFTRRFMEDTQIDIFLNYQPLVTVEAILSVDQRIRSLEAPADKNLLEFSLAS